MPTYEYACVDCGKHLEVVQSMSDPPLTVCATCGGRLRKVFSPIGIVFKGSGFYRTDSRGKSATSKDGSSKDGSSKDGSAAAKETSTTKGSSDSSSSGSSDSSGSSKSDSASTSKPASKPAEKSA